MTDLQLDRFEVATWIPTELDFYYAHRTEASQRQLQQIVALHETEDEHLPSALGTWGRGSHAYSCQRQNAFDNLQVPADYPFTGSNYLTFGIGTFIHGVLQVAHHLYRHTSTPCTGEITCPHSDALLEHTVDLRPKGWDHSGRIDMFEQADGIPVELKSTSDFGFKKATGKPGQGPSMEHLVQPATYALGLDAEWLQISYVNKGKHDAFATWLIPMEVAEPFALDELRTMERSRELVHEDGMLPPRWQAKHGFIDKVPAHVRDTGKWGNPFFCSGCRWNGLCSDLPTDAVPLDVLGIDGPVAAGVVS